MASSKRSKSLRREVRAMKRGLRLAKLRLQATLLCLERPGTPASRPSTIWRAASVRRWADVDMETTPRDYQPTWYLSGMSEQEDDDERRRDALLLAAA